MGPRPIHAAPLLLSTQPAYDGWGTNKKPRAGAFNFTPILKSRRQLNDLYINQLPPTSTHQPRPAAILTNFA